MRPISLLYIEKILCIEFISFLLSHEASPPDSCSIRCPFWNKVCLCFGEVAGTAFKTESQPWHVLLDTTQEGIGGSELKSANQIYPETRFSIESKYDLHFLIWLMVKKSIFDCFDLIARDSNLVIEDFSGHIGITVGYYWKV